MTHLVARRSHGKPTATGPAWTAETRRARQFSSGTGFKVDIGDVPAILFFHHVRQVVVLYSYVNFIFSFFFEPCDARVLLACLRVSLKICVFGREILKFKKISFFTFLLFRL